MNDKIITVEEAIKEMMNGEIVKMPKDEGTFFVFIMSIMIQFI